MSDPVTEVTDLQALHDAVMPDVVAEIAGCVSEVSTSGLPEHAAPPRVIWVPSRDRWDAPQKRPRGGGSTGTSLATCRAGADLHCWGDSITSTWTLVKSIVRALKRRAGPEPFVSIDNGFWLTAQGATAHGEAYVLQITVALDVPALPSPPRTATPTAAAIDDTRSSSGDGNVDAGETT